MYHFGGNQINGDNSFYNSGINQYPLFRLNVQVQQQRTLQTLKVQTDYLVTEINGIKEVIGEFITQVRQRLDNLTQTVAQVQRVNDGERPKKKFKKVINCPYEDCSRKYSSKIALNCHIRTKHKNKA